MDALLEDMVDTMERILKLQKELDQAKDDVARSRGSGTWVFERNGVNWVLRITKKPTSQRTQNGMEFDVSLQKAKKL